MHSCPVMLDPSSSSSSSSSPYPLFIFHFHAPATIIPSPTSSRFFVPLSNYTLQYKSVQFRYRPTSLCCSTNTLLDNENGVGDNDDNDDDDGCVFSEEEDGFFIEIEKIGRNSRRIRSRISIEASLDTVWNILTDYEKLSDFIPGLAVSRLVEKKDNFARVYQIGQQNLAFGLKFNAKGVVDCFEKELESSPFRKKRDIEFKMIDGDFQVFEGKWSIEQCNKRRCEDNDSLLQGKEFQTTLSYLVDVKPKLWLPVGLVEGRLSREIKINLSCVREEARKWIQNIQTLECSE